MKTTCGRDGRRDKWWAGEIHRITYLGTSAGLPSSYCCCPTSAPWCLQNPLWATKGRLFHPHLSFSSSFNPVLPLCPRQSARSHCRLSVPFKPVKMTMLRARSMIWFRGCERAEQSPVIRNVRDGLAAALQLINCISIKYKPTLSGPCWCNCTEERISNHNKEWERR